jgi:hypothetical protein
MGTGRWRGRRAKGKWRITPAGTRTRLGRATGAFWLTLAAAAPLVVAAALATGVGGPRRATDVSGGPRSTPAANLGVARPAANLAARASGDVRQVPAIVTSASGPVTVGTPIGDTASVSGGIAPTGTITFQLYSATDPTCSRFPVFASTVALKGDGVYRSRLVTPAHPGIYQWTTSYSGDANNLPISGMCPTGGEATAVLAGIPSLITTAPPAVPLGDPLSDTAVVAGGSRPTGALTFSLFGPQDPSCSAPPVFTSPPVTVAGDGTYRSGLFTPTALGTYRFEVRYSGDLNNVGLSTRCETSSQATVVAPATLALSGQPPAPVSVGESIVGVEVLSGGLRPTGTITFTVFGPNDTGCTGPPSIVFPALSVMGGGTYTSPRYTPTSPGSYTFVAAYSGDANNLAERTPCGIPEQTVSVSRAIPTIEARTVLHATVGASVVTSETLSGGLHPTGTITFTFYQPTDPTCTGRPLLASGPEPVAGDATYRSPPFTPPGPGDYRFVAAYSGDADNVALTTDCNAVNQAVLVSLSGLYVPADHPRSVIELEIVAFALLALGGATGANRDRLQTPAPAKQGPAQGSGASQASTSQGSVVATGLDNTSEGWEAVTTLAAAAVSQLEGVNRGDQSRTWRWPGTRRVDDLSVKLPQRVAPASPLIARITNDAGYLRAMFGSASALLPLTGISLAVVAVFNVHGHALPPQFLIAMALAVVGVLDALAGLMAVTVFVAGVIALGGLATANDARTLLGLSSLWFAAPIVAGVARPLRRAPTRSTAEHIERVADVVVAALVGAWAVKSILEGLPGLSGRALPIAAHSKTAALIVLAALGLRMVVETAAAHHYPARLTEVQPEALRGSGTTQHVTSAFLGLAVFVFVALPYVGPSWQLYLGAAFFAIPIFLKLYVDHLPNFPKLYAVIPRGVLETVAMLVVGTAFGAFVAAQLNHESGQQVIRESFLLLSLPGLAVSLLQLFGRDGPDAPKIHWLPEKLLGAAVLAIGVLVVIGAITI